MNEFKIDTNSVDDFVRTLSQAFSRNLAAVPKRRRGEVGLVNLRLRDYPSQLREDDFGFALVLYDLHHVDKVFRRAHNAHVIIRATKPERRHGKTQEISAVKRTLGIRTFQTVGSGIIPHNHVLAFCRRHGDHIMQLQLRGGDDIGITSSSIRFRWVSNDLEEMLPRFRTFALLVDEMTDSPGPQPLLFTREWLLKSTQRLEPTNSKALHSFGGTLNRSINCPHCGSRTNLMAHVDLADPALPRTRLSRIRLPVFWCLNCREWDPTFFDIAGPAPKPLDDHARKPKVKEAKAVKTICPRAESCSHRFHPERKQAGEAKLAARQPGFKWKTALTVPRVKSRWHLSSSWRAIHILSLMTWGCFTYSPVQAAGSALVWCNLINARDTTIYLTSNVVRNAASRSGVCTSTVRSRSNR